MHSLSWPIGRNLILHAFLSFVIDEPFKLGFIDFVRSKSFYFPNIDDSSYTSAETVEEEMGLTGPDLSFDKF